MKIYKYDLNYYSEPEIVFLPKNAQVIDFQIQDSSFKLWALVDPKAKEEKRVFVLAMTGQEFDWKVIKTFGTKIVPTGIVVHLLELDPTTKANDPKIDERLSVTNN